jgi:hypothetical protein
MNKNIFLDLMYKDKINVTGTKYQSIFEKSNFDITDIKLPELLWCAVEISNMLPTLEGVKFMQETIQLSSYFMKDQIKINKNKEV